MVLAAALALARDVSAVGWNRPDPDGRLNPSQPVSLKIVSPKMDEIVPEGPLDVQFEITNFEMKPEGPHLHFVLDGGPFYEHFRSDKPFVFLSLPAGAHVLAVFPVTSWHESWKDTEALALVRFHVGRKTPLWDAVLSRPLLIFNAPRGKPDKLGGHNVLFDFLLANVTLSDDGTNLIENYRVRYVLDGAESFTEYYEPRFWSNVKRGAHSLEVELTDAYGRPVSNGPWNRTRRKFSL